MDGVSSLVREHFSRSIYITASGLCQGDSPPRSSTHKPASVRWRWPCDCEEISTNIQVFPIDRKSQQPSQWPVRYPNHCTNTIHTETNPCDRIQELVSTQPVEEGSQERVRTITYNISKHQEKPLPLRGFLSFGSRLTNILSIKKPKTHRYPSLKGTDPKFRRNHKHALHGTMKALKEVKEGKRDTV